VAAHQPLAGVVGVGDLKQVVLIKQRQLQRPGLDQRLDLRGAQRGDPIQLRRAQFPRPDFWFSDSFLVPVGTPRMRENRVRSLAEVGLSWC
jgi:hypothetical protein